ncbi:hypothetical protein ECH_1112 [Ehrlichia chaffeensis str. Arkansas]|uniref:Uncharacterized protein n=1 Tax=Ehrlichia chaffeensis (strain ATCC CRL-10679 / Arkansas) TaxID=205920 RepID=Q2GF87_EHRCR|nr:hypothetical protein ECH_1112 [Ehrlichia chaffeensis str. Arkansas]
MFYRFINIPIHEFNLYLCYSYDYSADMAEY